MVVVLDVKQSCWHIIVGYRFAIDNAHCLNQSYLMSSESFQKSMFQMQPLNPV